MSKSVLHSITFGSSHSGLSTVGYTLYRRDNTVYQARTTTGVFEVGTATGVYACDILLPEFEDIIVLWDTGGASPIYGMEDYRIQLNAIQEMTDKINLIWNSMRNQGEALGKLFQEVGMRPTRDDFIPAISSVKKTVDILPRAGEFAKIHEKIGQYREENSNDKKELLKLIKSLLDKSDVIESKSGAELPKISDALAMITESKDAQFRTLVTAFDNSIKRLEETGAKALTQLGLQIRTLQQSLSRIDVLDENGKSMIKAKEKIEETIKQMGKQINALLYNNVYTPEQRNMLLTFSHRKNKVK